jgi:hypothetical protein
VTNRMRTATSRHSADAKPFGHPASALTARLALEQMERRAARSRTAVTVAVRRAEKRLVERHPATRPLLVPAHPATREIILPGLRPALGSI